jgi:hypothetical protein
MLHLHTQKPHQGPPSASVRHFVRGVGSKYGTVLSAQRTLRLYLPQGVNGVPAFLVGGHNSIYDSSLRAPDGGLLAL